MEEGGRRREGRARTLPTNHTLQSQTLRGDGLRSVRVDFYFNGAAARRAKQLPAGSRRPPRHPATSPRLALPPARPAGAERRRENLEKQSAITKNPPAHTQGFVRPQFFPEVSTDKQGKIHSIIVSCPSFEARSEFLDNVAIELRAA